MTEKPTMFDLVIIGGGPGGYVSAIRAGQLGLSVALIEKRKTLGGTCLNIGCIPSKFLLRASGAYHEVESDSLAGFGIEVAKSKIHIDKLMAGKDDVVSTLVKGIDGLTKKNKVTRFEGSATLLAKTKDGFALEVGKQEVSAKKVIIASGSEPQELKNIPFVDNVVVSSTEALSFAAPPKHLLLIGAGAIGLELGSVWLRLGSKVTVFEALDQIIPGLDRKSAGMCQRMLQKQGMEFVLGARVADAKASGGKSTSVTLKLEDGKTYKGDKLLVAAGRRPVSYGLGLDSLGIELDERGFIKVDADYRTNVDGVFAIGDVIGGMMLAHKASDEGVALVETIAGHRARVNYQAIPSVIYTHPEIASVGMNETAAKNAGIEVVSGHFPMSANARSRTNADSQGWVKIFAEKNGGKIIGGEIVGAAAGELIHELVLAIEYSSTAEDIAMTCHAHPTASEAIREAALSLCGGAIHI